MKLLRLCSYFYPEKVASSHLTDDMYRAFATAEIDCVCIAPEPSRGISDEVRNEYKDKKIELMYDGFITVKRFSMINEGRNPLQRACRYILCAVKTYRNATKEKDVDVVFVSSTPPTMGALGAKVAKKLSKKSGHYVPVIFNLQDIFPDSLVNAGFTKEGSLIWKIGRKLEDYTYRMADEIIVISEGFKKNIVAKGADEAKISVISNWIDIDSVHPVSRENNRLFDEYGISKDKFIVLYAGNFGEVQGAEIILDVAERVKENDRIQFVIFGGGALFESAKRRANEMSNVTINNLLSLDRVSEVYSLGDVALITCKPGTGGSAMPSKTWSIMACNTPIIASFDLDSDLASIIQDSGAGACVKAGDLNALVKSIELAFDAWTHDGRTDVNLRNYVRIHAEKNACLDKYIETIKSIRATT